MPKNNRKRHFIIQSDTEDSGSDDQIPVTKKCRKIIAPGTEDGSSGENPNRSHPLIPSSPRNLEDNDDGGNSAPHLHCIDPEPNSSCFSFVDVEKVRRQECPINYCFLNDLSSPTSKYVTNFQWNKQELIRRLYRFYNQTVFESQLPADVEISWNKRLTKTAGRTGFGRKNEDRYAIIQLSDKICDSAERLRDTLIHEMCHAACWLIDGEADLAHTELWEYYCAKAKLALPELPPITQFHTYEVHYTVVYQCSGCQSRVGRWRASLDTEKYECRLCHSKMVLLNQT